MDLDNIKKTWQETEIKPTIDNEKIQKMISNEGRSALEKLLWYEKLGMWLMIPCLLVLLITWHIHKSVFVMSVFIVIGGLIWQIYKLSFLKKLDVVNMNILEISSHVNRYKTFVSRELIVGIVVLFVFFVFYTFFTTKATEYSSDVIMYMLVRFIITVSVGIIVVILAYRYIYQKNINRLEASVKEVQEFEKDNK
jgi:hypothetical protein